MRNKLNYLIGVSLKRKMKTKWFLIANIILAILIVGVINIDSVINFFGGDFNEKQKIYIIDNTNETYNLFENQLLTYEISLNGSESESSYEITAYEDGVDEVKELISEEGNEIALIFDTDEDNLLKATVISDGYIDTIDYQLIVSAINSAKTVLALNNLQITEEEYNQIYSSANIERVILDETKTGEDEDMNTIMSTVFPVVILPFFMLTIFLVQMIGAEVNDEKTTKGMEIIISNVSPKTHFSAKVIAGNIFVLSQGALLLIFSIVGLLIRRLSGGSNIINGVGDEVSSVISDIMNSSIGSQLIYIIPLTLLLMILTFVSYSLLAGILASMTTTIEDFQQLQTPIMIISLIGYYLSMMAGLFKGAIIIRVLSYIPLISAILSPSLLVLGQIGVIDVILSIMITIGFNYLLIKYGLKIYKVGILNYSSSGLWKKMFKAIKSKENQ
ncbi:MAG: hypothetical protein PHE54_05330 [Bacilli bacterium]|nr:hypothetical protein [Bacilli bacterium]